MKDEKKTIYKIYLDDRLCYEVYSDGDARNFTNVPSFNESLKSELDFFDGMEPEVKLSRQGFMFNERYPRAFQVVCFITGGTPNDDPPFNEYKVEYFGEGEPWEPALEEGEKI